MNVPDEPDETCPKIDLVLATLAVIEMTPATRICLRDIMEKIRDANMALRQRAQFFEEEYGLKDEQLDKMTDERDKLEEELKSVAA